METWWQDRNYINQIVDWAYELEGLYPEAHVISIGQSPAWILRTLGMLRKMRGKKADITFAPFTNGFLNRVLQPSGEVMQYEDRPGVSPSAESIALYFNYLGLLGVQPRQLHAEIARGRQIVFTEMIMRGSGLASFLTVWARDLAADEVTTLCRGINFYIYDTIPGTNLDAIEIGPGKIIPLTRRFLDLKESDIITDTAPLNIVDEKTTRLVPMYRLSAAPNHPEGLELCPNQEIRKRIGGILHDEVQRREHHRAPLMAAE